MEAAGIMSEYMDLVQLNDHLLSRVRLSDLVAGMHCKNAGLKLILQFTLCTCITLSAILLGFANLDLENVIILCGYPCAIGTDPGAQGATDLGSMEAIASITAMTHEGRIFNGDVIAPALKFTVGITDFPYATDKIEEQQAAAHRKKRRWGQAHPGAGHFRAGAHAVLDSQSGAARPVLAGPVPGRHLSLQRGRVLARTARNPWPEHLLARVGSRNSESGSLSTTFELIHGIREIEGVSGLLIRSMGAEGWALRIIEAASLGGKLVYQRWPYQLAFIQRRSYARTCLAFAKTLSCPSGCLCCCGWARCWLWRASPGRWPGAVPELGRL